MSKFILLFYVGGLWKELAGMLCIAPRHTGVRTPQDDAGLSSVCPNLYVLVLVVATSAVASTKASRVGVWWTQRSDYCGW